VNPVPEGDQNKMQTTVLQIMDKFHIMAHINKAIDEVRARETRSLKEKGLDQVLTKSRWLLLKSLRT
jgi:transposase